MGAIQIGQNGVNVPSPVVTDLLQGVVSVTTQSQKDLVLNTARVLVPAKKQESVS